MDKLQFLDLTDLNPSDEEQLNSILYSCECPDAVELPPEALPAWVQHPVPYLEMTPVVEIPPPCCTAAWIPTGYAGGSGLQKKWRNIRDSYRKHWKNIQSTKSGQAREDKKQYAYGHQLFFLDDSMIIGPTEASPNVSTPNTPNPEENSDDDELQYEDSSLSRSTTKSPGSSASSIYRHNKKGLERKIEKYIDSFNCNQKKKQKCVEDECDDVLFFKSLLPGVQTLPLQEKLKFRIDVMNLAMGYNERNRAHTVTHASLPDPLPASTLENNQTMNAPQTLKNKRPKTCKKMSMSQQLTQLTTQQENLENTSQPTRSAAPSQLYGQPHDFYTSSGVSVSSDCFS